MNTLDEVIKVFSEANKEVGCGDCPFNDAESDDIPCEMPDCIFNDALHYLREYQRYQNTPSCNGHMALVDYFEESQKNELLTWDELKVMEGKPIWLELLKGSWKGWDVVSGFTDDDDFGEAMVTVRLDDYYKVDLGKMWQAYRKERK